MEEINLRRLNEARHARVAAILVTYVDTGTERVLLEGEVIDELLSGLVSQSFLTGRSCLAEVEGRKCFLNIHLPAPRLAIIGAVHIGQTLAQMALLAGFDTRVIDPRTAFATKDRFPGVALLADWPVDALDRYTAMVAVTHDPKIDDDPIGEALLSHWNAGIDHP